MKKASLFFSGLLFLLMSQNVDAQVKKGADFFAGKWNVLVKGTPNGDANMFFVLEKKDDKITGVVQDSTGNEISKIDNAEVTDDDITVYFNASGYDVNVNLKKKDDDHAAGSLLGMFDAVADRVKENE